MKTKLFLTSMLAVLVASPALATTDTATVNTDGNGEIEAGSTAESCSMAAITFDGGPATSGTVKYTAKWKALECPITLDPNNANGGNSTINVTPYPVLYARYADGAYRSLTDRTNSSNKMITNAYGLASTPGNLTLPTGATVTTTYTAHLPGSHALSEVGNWPVTAPATTKSGNRALKGYYSAETGGIPYIGGTSPYTPYYITTAGNTEASSIVADPNGDGTTCPTTTWYAQWDCVDSPLPTLALDGYTFGGWYTDSTYETSATGTCVVADRTVHAKWTAYTGTVTYTCGTGATGTISATTALEYDQPFSLEGKSIVDANCTYDGHAFTGWSCDYTVATGTAGTTSYAWANNAVTNGSGTYAATTNSLTITCDAVWDANTLNLEWYLGENHTDRWTGNGSNPGTCIYGTPYTDTNSIKPLNTPSKSGYIFDGWEVTDWVVE